MNEEEEEEAKRAQKARGVIKANAIPVSLLHLYACKAMNLEKGAE